MMPNSDFTRTNQTPKIWCYNNSFLDTDNSVNNENATFQDIFPPFFSLMLFSFLFYQKKVSFVFFFFFFRVLALWKISWLRELNEAVEREDSKSKPTDRALIFLLSFIIYFVFLWCVVISPPSLIYFGSTWAQCLLPRPRICKFHFHT